MLPMLPIFKLLLIWRIVDLCNSGYQYLLCQVLILMAMMMLPVSTLLHKHLHHYPNNNLQSSNPPPFTLHLHLLRICIMGGHLYHGRRKQHLMTVLSSNHMGLKVTTSISNSTWVR